MKLAYRQGFPQTDPSGIIRGQMSGRLCVASVTRGFVHQCANLSDTGPCICTVLHMNVCCTITPTAAAHNEVHKNSRWILRFEAAPSGCQKKLFMPVLFAGLTALH